MSESYAVDGASEVFKAHKASAVIVHSVKRRNIGDTMNTSAKKLARKHVVALVINIIIVVMEPATWCMMLFSRSDMPLTSIGLLSLRYFTVLSNLLLGLASLIYAICLIRVLRGSVEHAPIWAHRLKFAAMTAVTVTLMTVLLFLGPTLGYGAMFAGVNFWFHLALPVLGIVEFILFDVSEPVSFKGTLLGVLPTFIYGIFYCGNILINGVGEGRATNDWYGFAMWGVEYMPVVFAIMLLATWLFAIVLRALNRRFAK